MQPSPLCASSLRCPYREECASPGAPMRSNMARERRLIPGRTHDASGSRAGSNTVPLPPPLLTAILLVDRVFRLPWPARQMVMAEPPETANSPECTSGTGWGDRCSVFGKSSKIALGLPIPPHSFDGILPPALHLIQGTFVRCVTRGDHFLEMSVLRLYDLVCGHAMVRKIARATQLLAGHRLHESRFLSPCRTVT